MQTSKLQQALRLPKAASPFPKHPQTLGVLSPSGLGLLFPPGAPMFTSNQISSIAALDIHDVVGDYDAPAHVPEWRWIEANASFAHVANGTDGIWEFTLNLSRTWDDVPELLLPAIEAARTQNCAYLIIHQGI